MPLAAYPDASAKPGAPRYFVAPADTTADRAAIIALWSEGLNQNGTRMAEAKFDWYYLHNAEGAPEVTFLRHPAETGPVGVATLAPRRMRLDGQALVAGGLFDFVVSAGHRSLFPALFLQRMLRQRGVESRALVFGLPNPRSIGVVRRAGYTLLGVKERRVRVLRSAAYLARYLPPVLARIAGAVIDRARFAAAALRAASRPGFAGAWVARPDARFDALWERSALEGVLMGVRDARFLAWRFNDCPFYAHEFFTLADPGSGRLLAYAACRPQERALLVSDFLVDRSVPGVAARLWTELARAAHGRGHASLVVQFGGATAVQDELDAAGLVTREKIEIYASAPAYPGLDRGERWYLTSADEDG